MAPRHSFGRFEVRPDERRVLDAGEPVVLGARAFDLLLALIAHRDRVVGKDELMAMVWPGLVVEEGNLTVQVSALRKLLGADAISTVPGRGYRFTLEPAAHEGPSREEAAGTTVDLSLPGKPSIAVLPFTNMSGDPEQEYFTDGITEDIVTELSRFHDLFVIARNSSFTYKGKSVDVRSVAKELGVRYVLEGSIRRAGNRVRVTGQLVDAVTGNQIWAEKYDRVLEDIFAVQEEITQSIVASIAPQITQAESARARLRPESLTAYEIAVRADAHANDFFLSGERALGEQAIREALQALAIDPCSLAALRAIARVEIQRILWRTTTDAQQSRSAGMDAATRAIALDPSWHTGYTLKGLLDIVGDHTDRWNEALTNLRYAVDLNPNDAYALANLGMGEAWSGDPVRGAECLLRAVRMSPRDPWLPHYHHLLASAAGLAREYESARRWALAAHRQSPSNPTSLVLLAVSCAGMGELAAARAALEEARRMAPEYVEARLQHADSYPYRRREDRVHAWTLVRVAAGLEDPSAVKALR